MSLLVITSIYLLVLLVLLFVGGGMIWVSSRLCGIEGVAPVRSFRLALLLWLIVLLPASVLLLGLSERIDGGLSFWILGLAATYGAAWCFLAWILQTSKRKAFVVALVTLVGWETASFGLTSGVHWYLVETFMTPMGSMAPTLVGHHADIDCENCGLRYAISMSDYYDAYGRPMPPSPYSGENLRKLPVCLNCGHEQEYTAASPPAKGDRIVCDKLARPRRWDLVVFWYPPTGSAVNSDPAFARGNRVKYVKRLVGLPGEKLRIADGDVFANGQRLHKPPGEMEDLWVLVHDADYVPTRSGQGAWKPAEHSQWQFEHGTWKVQDSGQRRHELVFSRGISDVQAYNVRSNDPRSGDLPQVHATGDVKLVCQLGEFSGEGGFGFRWSYRGQEVIARVAASGETTLEGVASTELSNDDLTPAPPRKIAAGQQWEFAYRDGRFYVMRDGQLVASRLVGSQLWPRERSLAEPESKDEEKTTDVLCRVSCFAEKCTLMLSSLRLYRDLYYAADIGEFARGDPDHEYVLGPGECFMLGDNSGRSSDSRFWGPARREDLIGVVRYIYWPPSRWQSF